MKIFENLFLSLFRVRIFAENSKNFIGLHEIGIFFSNVANSNYITKIYKFKKNYGKKTENISFCRKFAGRFI